MLVSGGLRFAMAGLIRYISYIETIRGVDIFGGILEFYVAQNLLCPIVLLPSCMQAVITNMYDWNFTQIMHVLKNTCMDNNPGFTKHVLICVAFAYSVACFLACMHTMKTYLGIPVPLVNCLSIAFLLIDQCSLFLQSINEMKYTHISQIIYK